MKSKLSIIDPVHNTGIRLATGAFRTSWLESLYVESREHSLLWKHLLMCANVAKLAARSSHPLYSAVFYPTQYNKYELHITAPRPAGVPFHNLL
jgi:hypothetical protein